MFHTLSVLLNFMTVIIFWEEYNIEALHYVIFFILVLVICHKSRQISQHLVLKRFP
jgi:hypothetical protein